MRETRRIRASKLPLIALCPQAALEPTTPLVTASPEAALGTAFHDVMAAWVFAGTPDVLKCEDAAAEYGVSPEELESLCWQGWSQWQKLAGWFPAPQLEIHLNLDDFLPGVRMHLSGHPDVLACEGDRGFIIDWKTGWRESNYENQLMGYALLACETFHLDKVWAAVLWVRTGDCDGRWYTAAELRNWWHTLMWKQVDPEFNPGSHCAWCPRLNECPARRDYLHAATGVLLDLPSYLPAEPGEFRARRLGQLLVMARLLEPVLEQAKEQIRAEVEAAGGRLDCGDGTELVLTGQLRREVDAESAWDKLKELLGDDLAKCVRVAKGDLEALVRERALHGQKGAAVKEVLAGLEQSGAVKVTEWKRLELRTIPKPIEERTNGTNSNKDTGEASDSTGQASGAAEAQGGDAAAG